jgi:hypothetical protein
MASKTQNVKSYSYSFSAGPTQLFLLGDQGATIAYIRFIDETSPLPAPSVNSTFTYGTAVFRSSALPSLIDIASE